MSWLMIDVLDVRGRESSVEVKIRRDSVEFWYADRLQAVFDRDALRGWLSAPRDWLTRDDLSWAETDTGVALTVHERVPWWPVASQVLDELRERI